MGNILNYILLGVSLSAPVGPVNAAQMEKGIRGGFLQSLSVGFGAMLADILYMLLVYLGFYHVIMIPVVQSFLYFFGSFVFLYLGIESVLKTRTLTRASMTTVAPLQGLRYGFFLALVNPISIMFWVGVYGSVLAKIVERGESDHLLLYTISIFVGVFLWDNVIALLSSSLRRFLSDRLLRLITLVSGMSLLGFGIYFGYLGILSVL
ncbi:amino acid transporter [Terribacillus saccharophilus]|uniref:Amino acid transporter n=1 Tax=Terribacillus saccharophilus TaxID=361277 RepID=A0A075LNI9_9BACI|nr:MULTISPECIES: LysE family transporter [Terribacillus]AIF67949.1 amino acid transporter [Terribacillus goriensis]MCM3226625.1 LysE family translocator [Terribacillus saccharophilus]